ncbi:MAG: DUF2628 domain-containing protein [Alphaproteobacteria bacterium]|nr:DUF2628 domain-containing protein [Alphaproteobacteria bacterium]
MILARKIPKKPHNEPDCDVINGYYQNVFTNILNGKKSSWNWSAALFGALWLAYRKMYLIAFTAFLISSLLTFSLIIALIFITYGYKISEALGFYILLFWVIELLGSFVFFGLYGNFLYFSHLKKKTNNNQHINPRLFNVDKFSVWILLFLSCGTSSSLEKCNGNIIYTTFFFYSLLAIRFIYRSRKDEMERHYLARYNSYDDEKQ